MVSVENLTQEAATIGAFYKALIEGGTTPSVADALCNTLGLRMLAELADAELATLRGDLVEAQVRAEELIAANRGLIGGQESLVRERDNARAELTLAHREAAGLSERATRQAIRNGDLAKERDELRAEVVRLGKEVERIRAQRDSGSQERLRLAREVDTLRLQDRALSVFVSALYSGKGRTAEERREPVTLVPGQGLTIDVGALRPEPEWRLVNVRLEVKAAPVPPDAPRIYRAPLSVVRPGNLKLD